MDSTSKEDDFNYPRFAAGMAAAFALWTVSSSAPALTRPLIPSLWLLVLVPAAVAWCFTWLAGKILPTSAFAPRLAACIGALIGAAPFVGAAVSAMARFAIIGWAGLLGLLFFTWQRSVRVQRLIMLLGLVSFAFGGGGDLLVPSSSAIKPVVVYGIDAATFEQIDPMIAAGELPNLARIRRQGAAGRLLSEEPSISPRVWTVMATGMSAEQHGVVDFQSDRYDLKLGRFWDAAAEAGAGIGLMEWHITWPPDQRPGFGVPAWLARGFETIPTSASFLKRLERAGKTGHSFLSIGMFNDLMSALAVSSSATVWKNLWDGLGIVRHLGSRDDVYWRVKLIQARLQADLYFELMARELPGLSALILYPVDSLGHAYWRWHEPDMFEQVDAHQLALRGDVVRQAYREADYQLGRLLERVDFGSVNLVVVSDHGMEAATRSGGLKHTMRLNAAILGEVLGLEKGQLNNAVVAKQLILSTDVDNQAGIESLARVHGLLSRSHLEGSPLQKPFELAPHEPGDTKITVDFKPAILGDLENNIILNQQVVRVGDLFREENRTGSHTLNGIILMFGPDIQAGARIEGATIYDLAPTMLHLMGLQVPEELPGRVLTEAIRPSVLADFPVSMVAGALPLPPVPEVLEANPDMPEDNLRAMGYLEEDEE